MRALPALLLVVLATPAQAQAPGDTPPAPTHPQAPGGAPPAATRTQAPGDTPPAPAHAPAPIETPPALDELDADTLPEACRSFVIKANDKALVRALGARVSLASCLADEATRGLDLIDGQESVIAIDEAIGPSCVLLEQAIDRGAAEQQLEAQRTLATLYAGAATRMLQTVPRLTDATETAQALRNIRLANVETMIAPWREAEADAYAAIVKLAADNPRLERDRAYATTIATSRARASKPATP